MTKLRLGTRGSLLAMAQAHRLQGQLSALHPDLEIEIVPIKTSGDRGLREQLGAFVHEIQVALLDDRVDVGLHCLKDIPTEPVPGLSFAAYLEREDARDTIITRGPHWISLAAGSLIGTGSVRRTSQLAALGRQFRFKPLVGNVDTRLVKLMEGEYDAIVLAMAGLKRLGLTERWAETDYRGLRVEPLTSDVMLPAPAQAILVLETRESDSVSRSLVRPLHDAKTEREANAERSFLKAFGGGCSVPVAALAHVRGNSIELQGLVAAPDGTRVIRGQKASNSLRIGEELAQELINQGAKSLFGPQARGPLDGYRVLVTRAREQAADLVSTLEGAGAKAVILPSIEYASLTGPAVDALDRVLRNAGQYDAIVVTSARGAGAIEKRLETLGPEVRELISWRKLIAVGSATAAALGKAVREPDLVPAEFSAMGILNELGDIAGRKFLLLRADIAKSDLPDGLRERGATVDDVVAYRILKSQESGEDALGGPAPDFLTFMSSSGVQNIHERLTEAGLEHWMREGRIVCIGPVTANTVKSLGFDVAAVAYPPDTKELVAALVNLVIRAQGVARA